MRNNEPDRDARRNDGTDDTTTASFPFSAAARFVSAKQFFPGRRHIREKCGKNEQANDIGNG